MPSYFPSKASSVDTVQRFFDGEDSTILDNDGLDNGALDSSLELSPAMAESRRDSFAVGPSLFSPKTEDWTSIHMQSVPSNHSYLDQNSNNPYLRMEQSQSNNPFSVHGNDWSVNNGSNTTPPFQPFDGMTSDYEAQASVLQRSLSGHQTPFAPNQGNIFSNLPNASQTVPISQNHKEWLGSNQSMAKKMRPSSPPIRGHNELRRGDGIRKKNARFDIPAERNLTNIDQLISQSTDEQEIKELKQQKRLLRNRQAALDSRQRKKMHTERLEDEKKQFTNIINDMEDEMNDLRSKMEQLLREKQSYADYVETLSLEKEEMIRAHTVETGNLRKRVGVLTEHIQRLENNATPTPRNDNFTDDFGNMEGMTLPGSWNDSTFFDLNNESEVKHDMPIVPIKKEPVANMSLDKTASQGGLLFMLFLVGAFVMSSRNTPSIPRVSEDVRAASATILDNVLKDAGVNSASNSLNAIAPQPSGSSWSNNVPAMSNDNMHVDAVAPSMLEELSDGLMHVTEDQVNDQVFSLSAAQYNNINDQDFIHNTPSRTIPSQGRKNLAEALATMRLPNKQDGAADVYTRSLLWDQIPNDVVRNFAKMVAECNSAQNQQQCNEAQS